MSHPRAQWLFTIYTEKQLGSQFEQKVRKNTDWKFRIRFDVFHSRELLGAPGTELSNRVYGSKLVKSKW